MHIGTDIVSIQRINTSIEKFGHKFKEKFMLEEEIQQAKKTESIAGIWAAKEAISKALGCGICATLSFHDMCIKKDTKGAPYFELSAQATQSYNIEHASLSISHDGGFAIAVVVIVLKT